MKHTRQAFSIGQLLIQFRNQVSFMIRQFGEVTENDLLSMFSRSQSENDCITTTYYKNGMFYVEKTRGVK